MCVVLIEDAAAVVSRPRLLRPLSAASAGAAAAVASTAASAASAASDAGATLTAVRYYSTRE